MKCLLRQLSKHFWPQSFQDNNLSHLKDLCNTLYHQGTLNHTQLHMIEGILQYQTLKVRDVMIPRAKIQAIEINSSKKHIIDTISKYRHSRYPIYAETLDNIKGVFLAKDLITQTSKPFEGLSNLMRPILTMPESKTLDTLLTDFQKSHNHMAIVIDEYGGVSGLITIEDVIEQATGNIEDEHDESTPEKHFIREIQKGSFLVDTLTPVELFNSTFDTRYSDSYFNTIGGIIAQKFGKIAQKGDRCSLGKLSVTVLKASKTHIQLVEIKNKV